jgi:aryl-alcohol dehydrogenase-like predicted oxidoreductase
MDRHRRSFLHALGKVGAALALASSSNVRAGAPEGPRPGAPREGEVKIPSGTMPMRTLGKTGVKVSLLGLGGFHIGVPKDEKEGIRIIHAAMDHGVTFLDNCWDYHQGKSEERMGAALAGGRRQKVFLMTKLDGRTRESAAQQLEQSLRRLKTDVIDLVQVHEVIRRNDAERIFAAGGAMEALVAAQKAGKLRFIGFTGHKDPDIHLHMLQTALARGFTFDTVQLPLNVMDAHYRSFEKKVLPLLRKHDIAALGMKPLGSGILLESKVVSAPECLRYAMSLPVSVTITGCDSMGVLEQALAEAMRFTPLADAERAALLQKTQQVAQNGSFEKFKTGTQFDGTTRNPKWLETAEL